jgi:uroporphyrinogen decarboxylase
MEKMTKRERLMAAVKGEAVDRVPASYYNHNHPVEYSADRLIPALLGHQEKFDWDFVKVMIRASYYLEAWGCKFTIDPVKGAKLQDHVVKEAADYTKLKKLDPTKGPFGEHVDIARQLGQALKGNVPYMQSVFGPLTIAGRLAGGKFDAVDETVAARKFIDENPDELLEGLSVITETVADYVRECIRAGADGIFYTTTAYGSLDVLTKEEYKIFAEPFDLAILNAANEEGATLNILHICRENLMFDLFSKYPVQIINYESTSPKNPDLKEVMTLTDKAIWGGMDQRKILPEGSAQEVKAQALDALEQTGGRRIILGPGCTNVYLTAPDENISAIKAAVDTWEG